MASRVVDQREGSLDTGERQTNAGSAPRVACVLAAGRGSRLAPWTLTRAKPLVPFGRRPLLGHTVRQLRSWGIDAVDVLIRPEHASCAPDIAAVGTDAGMPVEPVVLPAGNWRSVFAELAVRYEGTTAVTLNCDLVLGDGWLSVLRRHVTAGADLSIAVSTMDGSGDGRQGRVRHHPLRADGTLATDGPVVALREIGISVVGPRCWATLAEVPARGEDPWAEEFVPRLVRAGRSVLMSPCDDYWRDVGTWDRLALAAREVLPDAVPSRP